MKQPLQTKQQVHDTAVIQEMMLIDFPTEKVPVGFAADLSKIISYASVGGFVQQGFSRELFNKLRDWQPPFRCMEMHLAIKLVESGTPQEYGCAEDPARYDAIQDRVAGVRKVFEEIKAPISEKIVTEINVKSRIAMPPGKRIYKPGE